MHNIHWHSRDYGTTEASDLGIGPGAWPAYIDVGFTRFFRQCIFRREDGDVTHVTYHSAAGRVLVVYND